MNLYIHTDIEGVAGMVHFENRDDEGRRNWSIRRRMFRLLPATQTWMRQVLQ